MHTVLVVDDEPLIRQALCRVLRQEGYETVSAASPADAVTKLNGWRPDVLLVDVNPDGPSGTQLLEDVCREPRWWAVPVVLLTGNASARKVLSAPARRIGAIRTASSLTQAVACVRASAGVAAS
jgi:two-component system, sensor histidine kinase